MRKTRLVLALLVGVSASPMATASEPKAPLDFKAIPICYNFGCKTLRHAALSYSEWRGVSNWFRPTAASAAEERDRIRQAIGWMEVLIGQRTPTHRDKALNLVDPTARFPGQLDCIDESRNTTAYLRLFESYGLMRWHRVVDRAYRRAIFDQHWAGQIEEIASGTRYVVDTWFEDNGYLPYVQPSEEWLDIPYFFTSYRNNATN